MGKSRFFAAAPAALSTLLASELEAMGARKVRPRGAGVAFEGSLDTGYRACLWSRVASRVLLHLTHFDAADGDALYAGVRGIDWHRHLSVTQTIAVSASTTRARIKHSHYAALRVKDAIVDHFREADAKRPSVDTRSPDIRIDLHLSGTRATLSLDLSGDALHRRGYRVRAGEAPLRETLAAAMLYLARWPERNERGETLIDPMCGAGTLVIEAALMAGDVAPGLGRERFGFSAWAGHDGVRWSALLDEAKRRRTRGMQHVSDIVGLDADERSIDVARDNATRAGVLDAITFRCKALGGVPGATPANGVVVCNPPYGRRMPSTADARYWEQQIAAEYPTLDRVLIEPRPEHASGRAASPTTSADAAGTTLAVMNGAIPCVIRCVEASESSSHSSYTVDTSALANRLRKRRDHLARWARRNDVQCFRLYDADLPEFAFAADVYEGEQRWLHVAEYAAPTEIPSALAAARLEAAVDVLSEIMAIERSHVIVKRRERQRSSAQYARQRTSDARIEVREHGARLLVNLHDYIDTGLFLDHRSTRRWIRNHAADLDVLNLFSYTAVASVHAALGGARSTLSVDLSPRYTAWAKSNLALNGFRAPQHRCLQADCLQWLRENEGHRRFDLVFMDPPTFSNSRRMRDTLDVQRDHVTLIRAALSCLRDDGLLIFSCNRRGFRIDVHALDEHEVEDVTSRSLDADVQRTPPPHHCFHIRRRADG